MPNLPSKMVVFTHSHGDTSPEWGGPGTFGCYADCRIRSISKVERQYRLGMVTRDDLLQQSLLISLHRRKAHPGGPSLVKG